MLHCQSQTRRPNLGVMHRAVTNHQCYSWMLLHDFNVEAIFSKYSDPSSNCLFKNRLVTNLATFQVFLVTSWKYTFILLNEPWAPLHPNALIGPVLTQQSFPNAVRAGDIHPSVSRVQTANESLPEFLFQLSLFGPFRCTLFDNVTSLNSLQYYQVLTR